MIPVPASVAPLVWALVFVLVVALIYGVLRWLEVAIHPKLERVMIFLVCLIVAVVVIVWLLGFLGYAVKL